MKVHNRIEISCHVKGTLPFPKETVKKKCPISRKGDFGAYRLRAGELGRHMEIDEVVSHENVGHAIAIVSHLQNEVGGNVTSGNETM